MGDGLRREMTLTEWSARYGVAVREHPTGLYVLGPDRAAWSALYRLSDCVVMAVCGPVVWLGMIDESGRVKGVGRG